jgi:hypothetical protein
MDLNRRNMGLSTKLMILGKENFMSDIFGVNQIFNHYYRTEYPLLPNISSSPKNLDPANLKDVIHPSLHEHSHTNTKPKQPDKYVLTSNVQCRDLVPIPPMDLMVDLKDVPLYEELPDGSVVQSDQTINLQNIHVALYFPPQFRFSTEESKNVIWTGTHHGFFGRVEYLANLNSSLANNQGSFVISADQPGHGKSQMPAELYDMDKDKDGYYSSKNDKGYPAHIAEQRAAVLTAVAKKIRELAKTDFRLQPYAAHLEALFARQELSYYFGHSMGGGDVFAFKKENRRIFETADKDIKVAPTNAWWSAKLGLSKIAKKRPKLARGFLRGYHSPLNVGTDLFFTMSPKARQYTRQELAGLRKIFSEQMQDENGNVDEKFLQLAMLEARSNTSGIEKALNDPEFIRNFNASNSFTIYGTNDTRVGPKWGRQLAEKGLLTYAFKMNHVDLVRPEIADQIAELAAMHFREGLYFFSHCEPDSQTTQDESFVEADKKAKRDYQLYRPQTTQAELANN